MQNWKLTLAYDGTGFHGWQVQPHLPTVQGTLAEALRRLTGETVLPQGSGRTDTGVHALGQVVSFGLEAPIPAENLHRALNRALPAAVRVLTVEAVPDTFHARHSAVRKTYEYRIFPGVRALCSPFVAPYAWDCPWPVEAGRMQRAAEFVLGEHDFSSFAASEPDLSQRLAAQPRSATRIVLASSWKEVDGLLIYRVTGTGFLHHMVRNLVGTFVDAGAGRIEPECVREILLARDRSAAGPTAPARGLFLVGVEYGE